ncbi:MAG: hypothetical protein IPM66_20700 [Acidobacteriota bacterium]|nr:MAG: hypothetical protein IPM66_20700 [Acidobacteriota bacterium]
MNGRRVFMTMAFGAILAISAAAQSTVSQKFTFLVDGKIGNEVVKKGAYKINYTDAETGTIEIKVGSKVLTIPFTRRQNDAESNIDRATYNQLDDGSRAIATITPRGKNFTLVLEGADKLVVTKK